MKVTVNDTTLIDIANAIREKGYSEDVYYPAEMGDAIRNLPSGGGNEPTDEELVITGNCQNRFAHGGWDWIIEKYGDRITTQDITNASNMFYASKLVNIPFDLNCTNSGSSIGATYMCYLCDMLISPPKMNNLKVNDCNYMFGNCSSIREFPEDYGSDWDWSAVTSSKNTYFGSVGNLFGNCFSLRRAPLALISHCNDYATYSYHIYYYGFNKCYALDEIVGTAVPTGEPSGITGNMFSNTVDDCQRLKRFVFSTNEDGTPKVAKWKNQVFPLTANVGYAYSTDHITAYNSGITADKEVKDDATYQALKNDPDWFTKKIEYSRYNHDSAVETINTLPDTSEYLASAGGSNTIKFRGAAGSSTDGGAINTLTTEEIAVATSKGWTVTLL